MDGALNDPIATNCGASTLHPTKPDVRQIKHRFVGAAPRIDPLALMRRHPLVTVGAAAGLGWLAGTRTKMRLSRLSRFATALHPLILSGGQMVATYLANRQRISAPAINPIGADHG